MKSKQGNRRTKRQQSATPSNAEPKESPTTPEAESTTSADIVSPAEPESLAQAARRAITGTVVSRAGFIAHLNDLPLVGVYLIPAAGAKPVMCNRIHRGEPQGSMALPEFGGWDIQLTQVGVFVRRADGPLQWIPFQWCKPATVAL